MDGLVGLGSGELGLVLAYDVVTRGGVGGGGVGGGRCAVSCPPVWQPGKPYSDQSGQRGVGLPAGGRCLRLSTRKCVGRRQLRFAPGRWRAHIFTAFASGLSGGERARPGYSAIVTAVNDSLRLSLLLDQRSF